MDYKYLYETNELIAGTIMEVESDVEKFDGNKNTEPKIAAEIKKLVSDNEKLDTEQDKMRKKTGGGITHPEVAKIYAKMSQNLIKIAELRLKNIAIQRAKTKDKKKFDMNTNSNYWYDQIKRERGMLADHLKDMKKKM